MTFWLIDSVIFGCFLVAKKKFFTNKLFDRQRSFLASCIKTLGHIFFFSFLFYRHHLFSVKYRQIQLNKSINYTKMCATQSVSNTLCKLYYVVCNFSFVDIYSNERQSFVAFTHKIKHSTAQKTDKTREKKTATNNKSVSREEKLSFISLLFFCCF